MNPNNQSRSGDLPGTPHPQSVPQTPPPSTTPEQKEAAVNVLRGHIDTLYGDNPVADTTAVQAVHVATNPQAVPAQTAAYSTLDQSVLQQNISSENPYNRTLSTETPRAGTIDQKQWKTYHSAWQEYYQKYYEAYYTHQQMQRAAQEAPKIPIGSGATPQQAAQPLGAQAPQHAQSTAQSKSQSEALQEIRQRLLTTVKDRATKVRKSRHFVPLIAALAVVLIFVFVQYNRVFIATVSAYVSPGAIDAQNIVIEPGANAVVGQESRLIIPKINVDVPVLYDVGTDHSSQMKAMESGVAHFPIPGANSHPGEQGNTVLSGHSSNDLFDSGDYKFIFAQLEKLTEGDTLYAHYQGKRYTYVVTKKEVVKPTEVGKLVYPTTTPVLTLITCTPLGTSLNRLLVTAEQISPNPAEATAAPVLDGASADTAMPGNSATLFERLFGGR